MGIRRASTLLVCMLLAACATSGGQQRGGSVAERKATLAHLQLLLSDERYAYRARPLDDRLSSEILDRWLSSLDPDRLDFGPDDILALDHFRFQLDDAIRHRDLGPVEAVSALHAAAVRARSEYALATLEQLFGEDRQSLAALWACEEAIEPPANTVPLDERRRAHVMQQVQTMGCRGHGWAATHTALSGYYTRLARDAEVIDPEHAFERFADAWVKAVDPDGAYVSALPPLPDPTQGGVGLTLRQKGPFVEIAAVIPGGPATESTQLPRLRPGDRLYAVAQDGERRMEPVVGRPLAEAVAMLRGEPGSTVQLGFWPSMGGRMRGGFAKTELVRERVTLADQSATGTILERDGKRIGVVTPHGFYADLEAAARGEPDYRAVSRDVARLLEDMKREEIDGVLVDLRGVAGGTIHEFEPMVTQFLGFGLMMRVRKPGRVTNERYRGGSPVWDGPLLLLVDADTASTAEMFAAAIRDHGRGVVAGVRTRGRGTVQTLIDLARVPVAGPPGRGLLSVTTAEVYSPAGSQLDGVGVEPDIHLQAMQARTSPRSAALPISRDAPPTRLRWEPKPPAFDVEQLNARHRRRAGGPERGSDPVSALDQAVAVLLDMIDEAPPEAAAAR